MAIQQYPAATTGGSSGSLPVGAVSLVTKGFSSVGGFTWSSTLTSGNYIVNISSGSTENLFTVNAPNSNVSSSFFSGADITIKLTTSETSFGFNPYFPVSPSINKFISSYVFNIEGNKTVSIATASNGALATTTDGGITWTTRNGNWGTPNSLSGAYSPTLNRWVLGGNDTVATSDDDGATWTTRTTGIGSWESVVWGDGIFIIAGNSGRIRTSTDGITWTTRTGASGTSQLNAVVYGPGETEKYIIPADTLTTSQRISSSTDGITWTARTPTGLTNSPQALSSVYYKGNYYVAGQSGGSMSTSTNGITWTTHSATPFIFNSTYTYILRAKVVNGVFVVVGGEWDGGSSTSTTYKMAVSNNGSDWKKLNLSWYPRAIGNLNNTLGIAGGDLGDFVSSRTNSFVYVYDAGSVPTIN